VRGKALDVKKIADELIGVKGVKHGKLVMTTTGRLEGRLEEARGDAVIYLSIMLGIILFKTCGLFFSDLSPRRIAILTPVGPRCNAFPTSVPI
jgi:hypothetical protein